MYDTRILLEPDSVIYHNGFHLRITEVIGKGGNAVAYKAEYDDTAVIGGIHKCILKELFPFHPDGFVYRDENGGIVCKEEAKEFFEIHKKSFLYGNRMHLSILENSPDSVGANFDSFEYNGTLYSIIGLNSMTTLSNIKSKLVNFDSVLDIVIKLAKAVDEFHKNSILHLDISPDNVIVSGDGVDSRVLLIDFNSCDKHDGKIGMGLEFASVNRGYSAPEIKMRRVHEVSYAADVFSVCAVFANLLYGDNFVYAATQLRTLTSLPKVVDLPYTAKSKLVNVISKGLRANTKLRYQSINELLKELYELRERVENRGISHAAMWETSRLLAEEVTSDYIENSLICNGVSCPSLSLVGLGNTVISGEGGLGKTTLYKKIQYDNTRVYNPKDPVCFYVPLYRYDGKPDFIKRYILSKIRYSENVSTFSDALNKLLELMREDKSFLFLLLDGINEISADKNELIKEISEISSYKGVGISVSERVDSIISGGVFDDFSSAVLQGLDNKNVRLYLNKNALAYPDDEKLAELLCNPLMLNLYTRSEKVFLDSPEQRPENNTREQIIHSYLESICERFKRSNPGDDAGLVRLMYIVEFLFPAICQACVNRTVIDYDSVKKVVCRDYKMLKSKTFSKVFKEYTGKSKTILDGIKNEDEWFDTALNQILIGNMALVVKENDMYHPMHMSFSEVLGKDSLYNQKKYNATKRRELIPKIIVILALVCTVGVSIIKVINLLKPADEVVYNKEDEEEIMVSVSQAVTNFLTISVKEEEVVKRLNSDIFSKEEKIKMLEDAEAFLESHEKKVTKYSSEGFRVDLDGMKRIINELNDVNDKPEDNLDDDLLREIYDFPGDYRENQKRFFAGLEFLVRNDVYSEDLNEACEIYLSYIDKNTELLAGKCAEFISNIDEERAEPLLRAMPEDNDFPINRCFYEAHDADKNSRLKNSIQCQNQIGSMTKRMFELMDVSNDVDEAYEK